MSMCKMSLIRLFFAAALLALLVQPALAATVYNCSYSEVVALKTDDIAVYDASGNFTILVDEQIMKISGGYFGEKKSIFLTDHLYNNGNFTAKLTNEASNETTSIANLRGKNFLFTAIFVDEVVSLHAECERL